jgi:hypothetical protein
MFQCNVSEKHAASMLRIDVSGFCNVSRSTVPVDPDRPPGPTFPLVGLLDQNVYISEPYSLKPFRCRLHLLPKRQLSHGARN